MNSAKMDRPYTVQEKRLKLFLDALVVVYGLAIFAYLLPGIIRLPDSLNTISFISDPAFVNNSVIKIGLCFLICSIAVAHLKFRMLINLFIAVPFRSSRVRCCIPDDPQLFNGRRHETSIKNLIPCSILIDGCIGSVLFYLNRKADQSYYRLAYLSPGQFRTLSALAAVVIRSEKKEAVISPDEIACNVDKYLSQFEARTKWITKLALIGLEIYPLLNFKPPLSLMNKWDRLSFVKRRFYRDLRFSLAPAWLAIYLQAMIRMGKQLCFMGYYNDEQVFDSIGYKDLHNALILHPD
jgi:hypothetical protein